MTVYIAQAYVAFDGNTNTDVWALGQAQWIKDNTQVLTGQALIVPGTAGERSSYCTVSQVEADGSLTVLSAWHVNDSGLLVQGLPDGTGTPPPVSNEWADATPYAINDVVTWNGGTYRCLAQHVSNLAAGWTPAAGSLWVAI